MWHDCRVILGLAPHVSCDAVLELPAHAPATHGMLTIDVDVADGIITRAEPILGAMHRGAEKLFESRDYRQVLSLANRHEWLSSFTGEVGVALLLERELGIEAPRHASWLRTLLVEYHRITSHLAFLGGYPWSDDVCGHVARSMRESLVAHLQRYVGTRMHTMVTVVGGVAAAPPDGWLDDLAPLMVEVEHAADRFAAHADLIGAGLGVVDADAVTELALSGPVARATGVAIDTRVSTDGLRYRELDCAPQPVHVNGDTRDRMRQLAREVALASHLVRQCARECSALAGEPTDVLLPKVLRVPDGEYSSRIDTPLGEAYWYLVSAGDKMPHRLGLRPASLHTVLALSVALRGAQIEDAAAIIASMPFVTGDAER